MAGALATELATDIKALELPALKGKAEAGGSFLTRLPLIGHYDSASRRFRALRTRIAEHLAETERLSNVRNGIRSRSGAHLPFALSEGGGAPRLRGPAWPVKRLRRA